MAPVDKGGLRYNLEVTDNFSNATLNFRTEMDKGRASLENFRGDLLRFNNAAKDSKIGIKSLATGQRELNTLMDGLGRKVKSYRKEVKGASVAERTLAKEQAKTLRQGKGFAKERNRQVRAVRAQAKAATALATASSRLALSTASALKNSKKQRDATKRVIATSKLATRSFLKESDAIRKLSRQRRQDADAAIRQARAIGRVSQRLSGSQGVQRTQAARQVIDKASIQRLKQARAGFLGVQRSSRAAGKRVSGFRRIFSRLATAFVFFAAARGVVSGFKSMVKSAIVFNSVIEQSTLGIAALIVAVGEVRDTTGQATGSAQQLALAQVEARKQVALLRKDGLKTAATFEQLTQTFQVAVAPGLQAGLNLDEIRELTVRISQAASAIGLPQEQLAEEIRSLLGGAITPRQTRIATSLGITNEDIKRLKETGTLAEELQIRFQAFEEAGEIALGTFSALVTNTGDALQQLGAEGGLDFFNEIKSVLKAIQESVVQITDQGILINPKAVAVVRLLFNGLRSAVSEAKKLGKAISFSDLEIIAKIVGATIAGAARVVAAIIKGFVNGLNSVARIFKFIQDKVKETSGGLGDIISVENLTSAITVITEFAVVFGSVLVAAKVFSALIASVVIPIKVIGSILSGVGLVMKGIAIAATLLSTSFLTVTAPIILAAAALIGIGILMKKWVDDTLGVELRFGTIVRIIKVVLGGAFKVMASTAKLALNGVILFFETGFNLMVVGIILIVRKITELASKIVGFFSKSATKGLDEFSEKAKKIEEEQAASLVKRLAEQAALVKQNKEDLTNTLADVFLDVKKGVFDAISDNKNAKGFKDTLLDGIGGLKGGLKGVLDKAGLGGLLGDSVQDEAIEKAKSLSEVFKSIPPAISKSNAGLKTFQTDLKKLSEDARQAEEDLRIGESSVGVTGAVAQQRKAQLQGERRLRKETLTIEKEIVGSRARQRGIAAKLETNSERVLSLEESTQKIIREGVALGQRVAEKSRKIAKANVDAGTARLKARQASKRFDQEEVGRQLEILKVSTDKKALLTEELALLNEKADSLTEGKEKETQKQINQLVAGKISLEGQLVLVNDDIVNQLKARKDLEAEVNRITSARIQLTATTEAARLRETILERRAELETIREIFRAQTSLDDLKIRAAESSGDVRAQKLRIGFIREEQEISVKLLNKAIQSAKVDSEKNALIDQRTSLLEANSAAMELELEILEQQKSQAQAINDIAAEPVKFGFIAAVVDFSSDAVSTFKTTLKVMTTLLEGVASVWNDIIGAALDPSKGPVDILAKFQDLLNQVVQQIISAFLKAQAFKLLGSLFGISGADFRTIGLGRVYGGTIPNRGGKAMPSPAHASAHGYADGGPIRTHVARPRGVDPRDTVPIWAQPGEHMMPVKRVMSYGLDLLEGMRRGIIDPKALRSAAGLGPRNITTMKAPSGFSLAGGGSVGRSGAPTAGGGSTKIVNVVSPELIQNELTTDSGQDIILNVIRANQEEL